jgi:hypothetical protein
MKILRAADFLAAFLSSRLTHSGLIESRLGKKPLSTVAVLA